MKYPLEQSPPEIAPLTGQKLSLLDRVKKTWATWSPLKKRTVIGGTVAGLTAVSASSMLAALLTRKKEKPSSTPANKGQPNLTFTLEVSETDKTVFLDIKNSGDGPVEIGSVDFYTSALIKAVGDKLAPPGTHISQEETENNQIHYQLTLPPDQKVIMEAQSEKRLSYSYDQALGFPLVGTAPQNVSIEATDHTHYPVPLGGRCEGEACKNPFPNYLVAANVDTPIDKIPLQDLNCLMVPVEFDATGAIVAAPNTLPSLTALLAQNPAKKVLAYFDGPLSDLVSNSVARSRFINDTSRLIEQFQLRGINVNMSTPEREQGTLLLKFIQELDAARNTSTYPYELSITAPKEAEFINHLGIELEKIAKYLNYLFVNFFGYASPNNVGDLQSAITLPPDDPTDSIQKNLALYQRYIGNLTNKLVLGITTQYKVDKMTSMEGNGFGQPIAEALPPWSFKCLTTPNPTHCEGNVPPDDCHFLSENELPKNATGDVPYVCDSSKILSVGNNLVTGKEKGLLVKEEELRGIFVNSIRNDAPDSKPSILHAAGNPLRAATPAQTKTLSIHNEREWQAFVENFQECFTKPLINGAGLTLFFSMVNALTDALMQQMVQDKQEPMDDRLKYSFKTIIYFITLYIIGAPVLPALAIKIIDETLQSLLDLEGKDAFIKGTLISYLMSLSTQEPFTLIGIATTTAKFLSSMVGSYMTHATLEKMKSWYQNSSTFFAQDRATLPQEHGLQRSSVLEV